MQEIGTIIDYLASTIDSVDLPALSGDEVTITLDCNNFSENFYTCMLQSYGNEPFVTDQYMSDPYVSPVTSPDLSQPPSPRKQKAPRKAFSKRKITRKNSMDGADEILINEIEEFRLKLKQHRIRRGLTQSQAAREISEMTQRKTSQTSLCRFENNQLHLRNMKALLPHFQDWVFMTSYQF